MMDSEALRRLATLAPVTPETLTLEHIDIAISVLESSGRSRTAEHFAMIQVGDALQGRWVDESMLQMAAETINRMISEHR